MAHVSIENAKLEGLWQRHFSDPRRERAFLSAVAFNLTFAGCRVVTHSIKAGVGPFHNMSAGGRHLHHSTLGIFGLIGVGYIWTYRWAIGEVAGEIEAEMTGDLGGAGEPDGAAAHDGVGKHDDRRGVEVGRWTSRTTAMLYGAAAALTLDEFALWFDLEDDYWTKAGRKSVDAVALFSSLLTVGIAGRGAIRELGLVARKLRQEL